MLSIFTVDHSVLAGPLEEEQISSQQNSRSPNLLRLGLGCGRHLTLDL